MVVVEHRAGDQGGITDKALTVAVEVSQVEGETMVETTDLAEETRGLITQPPHPGAAGMGAGAGAEAAGKETTTGVGVTIDQDTKSCK